MDNFIELKKKYKASKLVNILKKDDYLKVLKVVPNLIHFFVLVKTNEAICKKVSNKTHLIPHLLPK